ncbi:MAG: PKD domain-containing protein [Bacteroidota bacterium]
MSACWLWPATGISQQEANVWHFGQRNGLDFSGGTPVLINSPMMNQLEGVASISDSLGNLQFYTDGITVWTPNHSVMANGTNLSGNETSTQSALIIPFPGNDSLYYIFSVDAYSINPGLRYAVVNTAANGGQGAVVTKNTLLLANATEKLAAIYSCNNTDVWVVSTLQNTNHFYAYKINQDGLCDCPVISRTGQRQTEYQGHLKFSPDGAKLVTVMPFLDTELFQFDRSSGRVRFEEAIPGSLSNGTQFSSSYYGASFSPDNTKLYVTSGWWGVLDAKCAKVVQYDLNAANLAASEFVLYDNSQPASIDCQSGGIGALQLGPGGRLYITNWGYDHLHVIDNPNGLGASSNFIEKGISLNGSAGNLGLPNYIESYFDPAGTAVTCDPITLVARFDYLDSCSNQTVQFINRSATNLGGLCSFRWDFGDTNAQNSTSFQEDPVHTFSAPGTYIVTLWVKSNITCEQDWVSRPVVIRPSPEISLGADTTLCPGDSLLLDATTPQAEYRWQDGTSQPTFTVTNPGIYQVAVTVDDCIATDIIAVDYQVVPTIDLGPDTLLCPRDTVLLGDFAAKGDYVWQDGSRDSIFAATSEGTYWVAFSNACVADSDTITIGNEALPGVALVTDTALCLGNSVALNATVTNADFFAWQNGNTDARLLVSAPGVYRVTAFNRCGSTSDQLMIPDGLCDCEVYIPSAFTPNTDGNNDVFFPKFACAITRYTLIIFNRYGQRVFESNDPARGWDGTVGGVVQQNGVYGYRLSVDIAGERPQQYTGTVTLVN